MGITTISRFEAKVDEPSTKSFNSQVDLLRLIMIRTNRAIGVGRPLDTLELQLSTSKALTSNKI